jgi:hypothetical protein
MLFKDYINEKLQITKMKLPDRTSKYKLNWNDKKEHQLFDRLKSRTDLKRKEVVNVIVTAIDKADLIEGPYVLNLTKSNFKVLIYKEKDNTVNVKSIFGMDFKLRKSDRPLNINEAEELFDLDLSEFYKDGFVNSYYGSFLIEESLDRNTLEVFPEEIDIKV